MAKYFDVVAVRFSETGKPYMYQAPWCSGIHEGMKVLCEFEDGEMCGVVVGVCAAMPSDSDLLNMLMTVAGTRELKKIIAVYERRDFEYDNDEV